MGQPTPKKNEDFIGMLDRRIFEERNALGSDIPPLSSERFTELERECREACGCRVPLKNRFADV